MSATTDHPESKGLALFPRRQRSVRARPKRAGKMHPWNTPQALPFPRHCRRGQTLVLILASLLESAPAHLGRGAEQDPRMIAPPNAVRGKLPRIPPTPARDAARTFRVLDGFRMDLLAAEPLVASPVAMTYDENGRAYVCEMRDYPYTDKAHHQRNQENPTDAAIRSEEHTSELQSHSFLSYAV